MSIRTEIQSKIDRFPPSMRRIADVVLAEPRLVLDRTITDLARACDTSETTVVRFCRMIGFTGYVPFRLRLATELATESAQFGTDASYGSDITPDDSLAEMVAKISSSEVVGIRETADNLDLAALDTIVRQLATARTVILFGVGASSAGAKDLSQKLLRIGTTALWFPDVRDALVPATLLGPDDVSIAFSHSGRTRETVDFLRVAHDAGAFTVGITNVDLSPLAVHADVTLRTAVRETAFRSGAMASRIAQLTVVDYIFVAVARIGYDKNIEALQRTRETMETLRDEP